MTLSPVTALIFLQDLNVSSAYFHDRNKSRLGVVRMPEGQKAKVIL